MQATREIETTHDWPLVGPALELEVDPADLRRALRRAFEDRARTSALGATAARRVHEHFTWTHAITAMRRRIDALVGDRGRPPRSGARLAGCVFARVHGDSAPERSVEWELSECLARLRPFVDELLVVGEELTPRGRKIAGEYGARCVVDQAELEADGMARPCDWSLWLEADDLLDEEDIGPLRSIIAAQPESVRQLAIQRNGHSPGDRPPSCLSVVRRGTTASPSRTSRKTLETVKE